MQKCPVCLNDIKNEYRCQICGYDETKDFVKYRTITFVEKTDSKEYISWSSEAVKNKQNLVKDEIKQDKDTHNTIQSSKKKRIPLIILVPLILAVLLSIWASSGYMFYDAASAISNITFYIFALTSVVCLPIGIIILAVRLTLKKPIKKILKFLAMCFFISVLCVFVARAANKVIHYYETIAQITAQV